MRADGETLAFEAPCLVVVPAGVVHGFSWASESRGQVLTVSGPYLDELTARQRELATVFSRPAALPQADGGPLEASLARLAQELSWTTPGRLIAIEALLLTILVEALRLEAYLSDPEPRRAGPQAALVARFRRLVEAHYREEIRVEAYAAELKVHPKRLRAACLGVAEGTPLRLIQDRRLLEAKRLLLYSNMTIAETGYHIGFQDPAYFTRVFTKACRTSPRRFREAVGQGEAWSAAS
jgi:AraC family transcriptional activator of pobA